MLENKSSTHGVAYKVEVLTDKPWAYVVTSSQIPGEVAHIPCERPARLQTQILRGTLPPSESAQIVLICRGYGCENDLLKDDRFLVESFAVAPGGMDEIDGVHSAEFMLARKKGHVQDYRWGGSIVVEPPRRSGRDADLDLGIGGRQGHAVLKTHAVGIMWNWCMLSCSLGTRVRDGKYELGTTHITSGEVDQTSYNHTIMDWRFVPVLPHPEKKKSSASPPSPAPKPTTPTPGQGGAKENYVFRSHPRLPDASKWEPLNLSKHFAPGKPRTDDSPSSWSTRAQLAGPTSVSVQDAVGISLDTASTPDSEFLHLSPAEQLIFSVDSSFGTSYSRMEKIRAILHLTNKFGMSVAYKVKATNAAAYSVSPATGVLKKGESVRVVFECQEKPAWYNPGIGKNSWVEPGAADRFLVDAFAISEAGGDSCPNYKAEWMLAAEKDHIKSYRLEVVGARKPEVTTRRS